MPQIEWKDVDDHSNFDCHNPHNGDLDCNGGINNLANGAASNSGVPSSPQCMDHEHPKLNRNFLAA